MVIAWNRNKVEMRQFWVTKGTITGHFAYIGTSTTGFVTNVYGPHKTLEKMQFIADPNHYATLTSGNHWIIGGDYNMIKSFAEKKGGICRLEPKTLSFTQMIDNLNLIDLEPTNGCFTWNNKRGGKHQKPTDWIVSSSQSTPLWKDGTLNPPSCQFSVWTIGQLISKPTSIISPLELKSSG